LAIKGWRIVEHAVGTRNIRLDDGKLRVRRPFANGFESFVAAAGGVHLPALLLVFLVSVAIAVGPPLEE
jgi:hypothetical protein